MYDKVKVTFADGTTTIIFVSEDDEIRDALANLADETGAVVANYSIEEANSD